MIDQSAAAPPELAADIPLRLVEGGNMDSDVGVRWWRALENGLDGLALRCRVIRVMLNVDRKRALELFRSMPPVMIPARSCSDAMVERVDVFYETLALLVNQAFSETGKREGKHLELAESYIHSITAPAQLEPAAKMILDLKLDCRRC